MEPKGLLSCEIPHSHSDVARIAEDFIPPSITLFSLLDRVLKLNVFTSIL